jgi:hypothetical protein
MARSRTLLASVACAVLTLSMVSAGRAETPSTAEGPASVHAKERALALYERGSSAFAEGRYRDAIELFVAGDEQAASPAFAYNVSLAYAALGDAANALRWAREYLRRSPEAEDRREVETRIAGHEKALTEKGLAPVAITSSPAGATVRVDGSALGVTPWYGALAIGQHDLELSHDGFSPRRETILVDGKGSRDVARALVKLEHRPKRGQPPKRAPQSPPHRQIASQKPEAGPAPWSFIAFGAGAASLAVAGGLEALRSSAEESAMGAATQIDAADEVERMQSYQLGSRVMIGVGGGLVVLGGVLLGIDLATKHPATATRPGERARLGASCGPHGCQVAFATRFQ